MIDLHSHILPGCDDGAADLAASLAMARVAVADGTRILACTPHILPGLYHNDAAGIGRRVLALRKVLSDESIDLQLVIGADVHIAPDLLQKLADKAVPTLNGSRYFLLEPPHHVVPPNFVAFVERLIEADYIPVVTHPERLTWVAKNYDLIESVGRLGALMQITAGSLTGQFGTQAKALSDRMLEEGRIDLVASDAHNVSGRSPVLSTAYALVEEKAGAETARNLFVETPARILRNAEIRAVGMDAARGAKREADAKSRAGKFWRMFQGR
ncbi:tyrosine-protein phosphatase [Tianweitania sp.]|uniref:tyrosine-protein phosphatase n=1 Tax=Tianweitania sp. TaxID=2021634 RepID=UPI00289FF53E|nr:CpsB/CapC family capsule biosynthesis tyrosine phosphatase [Tianweitania sp.]